MASSIVHLAVTDELIKRHHFRDTDRLRFGAVVVDAGCGNSHIKIRTDSGKKTYELDRFRQMFDIMGDDLYLGYYLHLIQDICYRHFVYDRYHWDPHIPGNIDRLHRDYSIVNPYIIRKYSLKNDIVIPAGLEYEAINRICPFDVQRLMQDMDTYFTAQEDGEIFFFTREMSDEYIAEAAELCMKELDDMENGRQGIDIYEYAW